MAGAVRDDEHRGGSENTLLAIVRSTPWDSWIENGALSVVHLYMDQLSKVLLKPSGTSAQ